ncbi:sulfatase [Engelhardtia mirabilis]|uniref:Sulfatase n=1 Tax=Engelhardtia mirabilis TaxID=2528011 RepID=A0A518BP60_9BACT|nr:Sulfatase [Planctomycetes bacterium Pla133]QDV03091.1 Sulfatase [Planctomycetes bacterium Pla86]
MSCRRTHRLPGVAHPRRRSRALALVATLAAAGALGACREAKRPGEPPRDVLLITVDTLRADHVTYWNYPRPTTNLGFGEAEWISGRALAIDDLAGQGVAFANAFAPRGQTFPSVATLMTGATPFEHGSVDNRDRLRDDVVTLAERLGEAGFATGGFTANRLLVPGSGIEQGFDRFFPAAEQVLAYFGDPNRDRDRDVLAAASEWVTAQRAAEPDRPTFTWVHLMGPHLPYDPAPLGDTDFAAQFVDPYYEGEADGSREFLDAAYAEDRPLSGLDVQQVVSYYDAEIARVNRLLNGFLYVYGRIDEPDGVRPLERTLLVFAADHGEELYQRNRYWAHSKSVYSSVLHVPLFFRHPKSLTGRRVMAELVTLADVAPTICDWFELEPPNDASGRSLLPTFYENDPREFAPSPAFGHWRDSIFTVRTEHWRLVWNPDGVQPDDPPAGPYHVPPLALYDLERDPLELVDCAAAHPKVVAKLLDQLQQWIASQPVDRERQRELGADRAAALEALGYIDGDEARRAGAETRADPEDGAE